MAHPDMRTKKQVTARITDQFAKDLNLVMACTGRSNATDVVHHAIHQLAQYCRHVIQRQAAERAALQENDTWCAHCGDAHAWDDCKTYTALVKTDAEQKGAE